MRQALCAEIEEGKSQTTCRICDSRDLTLYLDLGDQPPSNDFLSLEGLDKEKVFPLAVVLCHTCSLSQLSYVVSPTRTFHDYAYLSSTSRPLVEYYQKLIDWLLATFSPLPRSVVVDIGSNDGIMLRRYPPGQFIPVGVEPSSAAEYAERDGFPVVRRFFDELAVDEILRTYGPANIITATNVLAHVDDIQAFAHCAYSLLADGGVLVTEFPYLLDMLDQAYFDTIYHEHLSYLALTPLVRLFADAGLRCFRVDRSSFGASGPALRILVCRDDAERQSDGSVKHLLELERNWGVSDLRCYEQFANRVQAIKEQLLAIISGLASAGHRIGAFTAPAKGNTLLNFVGLTSEDIVAAAETNPRKIGKVTPGTHIPIVSEEEFLALGIPYSLLLSWNYVDYFCRESEYAKRGGKFIVPLPSPLIK